MPASARATLVGALLVAVGVATYANSLWGVFLYDDRFSIVTNQHIRHLWPLWEALQGPSNTPVAGRPVVNLSLAANFALGGLDVRGYHALNITVHILCSLILFGIVRRTLLGDALQERFERSGNGIAAACALTWLVHPIQTEPVNYITQRTESLMALFYLLTLYTAIRAGSSEHRTWWTAASVLSCGLGMASKETMVTVPVMVVLYDWVFRCDSFVLVLRRRRALYAGLATTWGIIGALMWTGPRSASAGFSTNVSALDYAMNQGPMIAHYLRLAVWPSHLLLDHGMPVPLTAAEVAPYAALVAALIVATVIGLIYRPMLGFLGAWFFLILAPTSSIVPIATEVGAERRMYLPLAGLIVLAVTCGYLLLARAWKPNLAERSATNPRASGSACWVGVTLVTIVAASLSWASVRRNAEYRSAEGLWRTVIERRPQWRAHNNLGIVLAAHGRHAEAINEYKEALRGNPDSLDTHASLGISLLKHGKLDEATDHFRRFLEIPPNNAAIDNYALIEYALALALEAHAKPDEAMAHYRRAVELKPDYADAHFGLGLALSASGHIEGASGHIEEGLEHFREAVRLKPELRPAVDNALRKFRSAPGSSSAPR